VSDAGTPELDEPSQVAPPPSLELIHVRKPTVDWRRRHRNTLIAVLGSMALGAARLIFG
jgi:hypothetical protein